MGAMLAREFGDVITEARLHDTLERVADPRSFGVGDCEFGFWFHYDEPWPRGQLSASLMVTEVADPGDWQRLFNKPNMTKFVEPTVEGVDFPTIGLSQAWNDLEHGMLQLRTYVGTQSERGRQTHFKVINIPDVDDVFVRCNGEEFRGWSRVGDHAIDIQTHVDTQHVSDLHGLSRGFATRYGARLGELTVGAFAGVVVAERAGRDVRPQPRFDRARHRVSVLCLKPLVVEASRCSKERSDGTGRVAPATSRSRVADRSRGRTRKRSRATASRSSGMPMRCSR